MITPFRRSWPHSIWRRQRCTGSVTWRGRWLDRCCLIGLWSLRSWWVCWSGSLGGRKVADTSLPEHRAGRFTEGQPGGAVSAQGDLSTAVSDLDGGTMDFKIVEEKVHVAIDCLLSNDSYLLEVDANERAITHWLGVYLHEQFEDWDVDCEYNRQLKNTKRLFSEKWESPPDLAPDGTPPAFDTNAKTVYPDIIIHRRGTDRNLLVIEVKKTSSDVDNEFDLRKLCLYREQLHYRYGLFMRIAVGKDFDQSHEPYMEWIR
jgi:hypothetical protein